MTQITDVKPLATVVSYIDEDTNREVFQEVRGGRAAGLTDSLSVCLTSLPACLLPTCRQAGRQAQLIPGAGSRCDKPCAAGQPVSHRCVPA